MSHRLSIISECIAQGNQQKQCNNGLQDVYIVAGKRTPIGSYMGAFSNLRGPQLASYCIKSALQSIKLSPTDVEQVVLGNVLTAGVGQAPARQAATLSGLPATVTCTTVNKVCASGMKSIVYGCQSIQLGHSNVAVVGGFQSMSNAPHLIMNARKGVGHGDRKLIDSLTFDGLTDPFHHISMGLCAENTAKLMKITREDQDQYCKLTYKRHLEAQKKNILNHDIVPIEVQDKKGKQIISKDQQGSRYNEQAIPKLKPAFDSKQGTITSANASKINDGACCLILMSGKKAEQKNVKPLAKIIACADAEIYSTHFCRSPYYSTVKALEKAGLKVQDIDYFEYNEAFSVVPIAMMQMLKIPSQKMNALGGAVAMGHPIGASGARIVQSLITTLKLNKGKYGLAAICNGGGGSTAIIIQNVQ